MNGVKEHVKSTYANREPKEILSLPVEALLGASAGAATALESLGIHAVFDLALSSVFSNACKLVRASETGTSVFGQYDRVPADVVDRNVDLTDWDSLEAAPIQVLSGIDEENGPTLSQALDVVTVRDLSLWPPYRAARAIFDAVYNPEGVPGFDPSAPDDLIPKTGEYPTDRVFYTTIVIDTVGEDRGLKSLEEQGQLDILSAVTGSAGFTKPALGALLTYAQSWYTKGVALGHLLHSVALAPGESTKITILDWTRQTRSGVTESISESEALANTMTHNRAIGEVTSAVASESQSGFSKLNANSTSEQSGWSAGGAVAGAAQGIIGGIGGGYSQGRASNTTSATSFSSSQGRRELSASMAQHIVDTTHQAASSARNRRASLVREVTQTESEKATTRTVTNYNHMHALSINYYEVVQIYRVAVQLREVQKCLFVPLKLIDFSDPQLIERFRYTIAAAALIPEITTLQYAAPDKIMISFPAGASGSQWTLSTIQSTERALNLTIMDASQRFLTFPRHVTVEGNSVSLPLSYVTVRNPADGAPPIDAIVVEKATGETVAHPIEEVIFTRGGGYGAEINLDMHDVRTVRVRKKSEHDAREVTVVVTLWFVLPSTDLSAVGAISATVRIPAGVHEVAVFDIARTASRADVQKHLQDNAVYYSQQIWRSLDTAAITVLLAPYTYEGKPILQLVDSTPVAATGNFLVFRMHADKATDGQWKQWLEDHGIDTLKVTEDIVPLPSGGVFAEAVLGRFNCAEKLDITRFWNWQDSPIPVQAPEIAPVQIASRAQPDTDKPGQLSQPLVNIVNPTPLPNPQGLGAALSAVANGNMFRDMSGLASLMTLAQAAVAASSQGASDAAEQAGTNMDSAFRFVEAMAPALAQAQAQADRKNSPTSSNVSNLGAALNAASEMDGRSPRPALPAAGDAGGAAPAAETPAAPAPTRVDQVLGTCPPTPPQPPAPRPKPTGAKKRQIIVSPVWPGSNVAVDGTYTCDLVMAGQEGNAKLREQFGFEIPFKDRQPRSKVVTLPSGLWMVTMQAKITALPAMFAPSEVPVSVPVLGSLKVQLGGTLLPRPMPFTLIGEYEVKPTDSFLNLRCTPTILDDQVDNEFQLTADGQVAAAYEAQIKAGVQAELNELVAKVGASGEVVLNPRVEVRGSIGANQKLTTKITYKRVTGFELKRV
ncbi:hypothetical protein WME97_07945 [Sorangium sp. So ce367]|uniref:hypothetical protein n=1 Tax=Sorangium sp. So ce367 TaxID=3133305 RepID=UPI003F6378AA